MNHAQVLQLNAALRDTIEFRSYDRDERGNPILPIAAGAAGLGGLAVGGAYLRGRSVPGPVRPGFQGFLDTTGQGFRALGQDIHAGRTAAADFIRPKAAAAGTAVSGAAQQATGAASGVGSFGKRVGAYGQGLYGAAKDTFGDYRNMRPGAGAAGPRLGIWETLKRSGKALGGRLRGLRFSSTSRITELNAALREVITMG